MSFSPHILTPRVAHHPFICPWRVAPYNIIRTLLNIKNVTLKWLIHLRCKHKCVPEMSFLICGCGEGALRTTVRRCGWRRLSKRLQQQEQRAGAGVTKSKKRNSRPITPFKLYKPTCLPRQYSTAAQVIGFQKRSVRVKGSEDDKEQKKNYIYPDVGNFFSHSIVSSVHIVRYRSRVP